MATHWAMPREWSTLGDTQGVAQALVDTLADTLPEVEAVTLGYPLGRCAGTGRQSG